MFSIDLTELNDVMQDLQHDMLLLEDMLDDPYFVQRAEEIISDNFQGIWASKGGDIGADWNGYDLVQTGNLRDSLTNTARLRVIQVGNVITFGSNVDYAPYVNDRYRFFGVTQYTALELSDLVGEFLRVRGRLNWS